MSYYETIRNVQKAARKVERERKAAHKRLSDKRASKQGESLYPVQPWLPVSKPVRCCPVCGARYRLTRAEWEAVAPDGTLECVCGESMLV